MKKIKLQLSSKRQQLHVNVLYVCWTRQRKLKDHLRKARDPGVETQVWWLDCKLSILGSWCCQVNGTVSRIEIWEESITVATPDSIISGHMLNIFFIFSNWKFNSSISGCISLKT